MHRSAFFYCLVIHVYIIAADDAGPVKIGFSKNPEKRLKQFQTGHPQPLRLCHSLAFEGKRAKGIERIIHQTINHLRVQGEWFGLTVADAIAELEFAMIRYGDADLGRGR
jgi:hypothetical protein